MNPGIGFEPFELMFEEDYFKLKNWLRGCIDYFVITPWYIRVLGFRYKFQLQVLGEPTQKSTYYIYPVQYKKRMLYWFNFKVWTYE